MPTIINNTETSSISTTVSDAHTCTGCPRVSTPQSGSNSQHPSEVQLLIDCLTQMGAMQAEITVLKAEQGKTAGFYRSLTKLSNISRIVIWILLIIPMVQIVACVAIVYHLGIQDELPSLLNWVLGGVSIFSIAEMIALPIKFLALENRMNEIERKLSEKHDAA